MSKKDWREVKLRHYQNVLGLNLWRIDRASGELKPENRGGYTKETLGYTLADPEYFHAIITFSEQLTEANEKYTLTVLHEVLHVLLSEFEFALNNHIFATMLNKKQRKQADYIVGFHLERLIVRLSEIITRLESSKQENANEATD